jgi:hypothetical protein
MNDLQKGRKSSKNLAVILLGLGLAVFLWGMSYKMSLYEPDLAVLSHISNAKLISESARDQISAMIFDDIVSVETNRDMGRWRAGISITSMLGALFSQGPHLHQTQELGVPFYRAAWSCDSGGLRRYARVIRFRPPPALA